MQVTSDQWKSEQQELLLSPAEMTVTVTSKEPVPGEEPVQTRWVFSNDDSNNNLVSARLELPFDPTRTTLPIQSFSMEIENGTNYTVGLPPVSEYDFADDVVMKKLSFPTTLAGELGFHYASGESELLPSFQHNLVEASLDDNGMYLTLNGESIISQLDRTVFYGGRYVPGGIDAKTLLTEILSSVTFRGEGDWNYIIGTSTCVTSTTRPLWANSGFQYWVIDPELARFKIELPVPAVSHRQALQYVASYVGADIWVDRHGRIVISNGLYSGDLPDCLLGIDRVYDRPKRIRPDSVGEIESKLNSYTYADEASEIANVTVAVPSDELNTTRAYRIVHDGCHGGSLSLTGATIVGTPSYYTYSTEFLASSANSAFTAVLTGKKVEIATRTLVVQITEGGTNMTYDNPLASDEDYLRAALRQYAQRATAPQYEIRMRDDPAIDNGDRLKLEQIQSETPTPVIVGNITREFAGSLDATYILYENLNRYVEDFSRLENDESIIGYDGWTCSDTSTSVTKTEIGETPMVKIATVGTTISKTVDLCLGSPLRISLGVE